MYIPELNVTSQNSSFLLIQFGQSDCELMVLSRKCNCTCCMYEHNVCTFRIGGINCIPKCLLINSAVHSMHLNINSVCG